MLAMPTGLHFFIAALCLEESVVAVDEIWEKCKLMIKVSRPTANWLVDLDEVWPKNEKKYGVHFIPVDIICKKVTTIIVKITVKTCHKILLLRHA